MIRPIKYTYSLLLLGLWALSSCTDDVLHKLVASPEASIERDVRGHEQIARVQAILRLAHFRAGYFPEAGPYEQDAYISYDLGSYIADIPLYQEIDLSKDERGNMTIDSERKVFDVIKGEHIYYTLELKYYDINDQLINHQFASYYTDEKGKIDESSTLPVHQHFFTVQTYALGGRPGTYPMTLDSLYLEDFLLKKDRNKQPIRGNAFSPANVYLPEGGYTTGQLRYSWELANKAEELKNSAKAELPYRASDGKNYLLYQALESDELNKRSEELFTYEYRDTDPIESPLGSDIEHDDFLEPVPGSPGEFAPRERFTTPTQRLRKERSLVEDDPLDALGMKGALQFKRAHVSFMMRICICHIIASPDVLKYDREDRPGGVHRANEISPLWNSFDIDYPLPIRVIADADGDKEQCVKDIQRYYPQSPAERIQRALWSMDYYRHLPFVIM